VCRRALCSIALPALLLVADRGAAQTPEPQLWGVDNNITGIARAGNTIYVAGAFSQAGATVGGGVAIDRRSGTVLIGRPRIAGIVNAVISDGSGGWYVGGAIVGVGGEPRTALAHILADGRVSAWEPHCDGRVMALALHEGVLYVGGRFDYLDGSLRLNLGAFDASTGRLTEWNPGADNVVLALLPRDSTLLVGGNFGEIAGQTRWAIAELDLGTGTATSWNPKAGFSGGPGTVRALAMIGDTVYVGGNFGSIGGQYRYNAGAVSVTTGAATSWDPWASGFPDNRYDGSPYVNALVPGRGTMYVGGHFAWIKGQPRGGLAEVDLLAGEPTAWNPRPRLNPGWEDYAPHVNSLLVSDRSVYACGNWSFMGDSARQCIAEVDRVSGLPTAWNPHANSVVDVLAMDGDVVFAGGRFEFMGDWHRRHNLAAFDATTGRLKDWNPNPDGLIVYDVAVHEDRVYVAGDFWTVGGAMRGAIAAVDTVTGAALDWTADMNQVPERLKIAGGRLYVAGAFSSVGGLPRVGLASFDLATGRLTDWAPGTNHAVHDVAIEGNTVYVGGWFDLINGIPRRYLAAVDAVTGAVLDWDPSPDQPVQALITRGDTVFAGGGFGTIGGQPRSPLAALDGVTGATLDWAADAALGNPSLLRVFALELAGDTLYVGGSFDQIAGQARGGLAALDADSATVLDWDPGLADPTADYPFKPAVIWALTAHENTLYVGGRFRYAGSVPVTTLAALARAPRPVPGSQPPPRALAFATIAPNPVASRATARFGVPTPGPVSMTVYDIQGREVSRPLDDVPFPAGTFDVAISTAGWARGFYFLRIASGGQTSTRKFVVLD
jgi:hypothetical protein